MTVDKYVNMNLKTQKWKSKKGKPFLLDKSETNTVKKSLSL